MAMGTYTTDGVTGLITFTCDGTTGEGMSYAAARVAWLRLMVGAL
jgi:hypothetical protein